MGVIFIQVVGCNTWFVFIKCIVELWYTEKNVISNYQINFILKCLAYF